MKWRKNEKDTKINQQYYVMCDDWTICKVSGKYDLWHGKTFVKTFEKFEEAKNWHTILTTKKT